MFPASLQYPLYPMEVRIHCQIQSRTGFFCTVIMKNFNVWWTTWPILFQWCWRCPIPLQKTHPFEAVKYLFQFSDSCFRGHFLSSSSGQLSKRLLWPCTVVSFDDGFTSRLQGMLVTVADWFLLSIVVLFVGDNTCLFDPRIRLFLHYQKTTMHFFDFLILYEGMCASFYLFLEEKKN